MPVAELFRALGDQTRLEMVRRLTRAEPHGSKHTITSVTRGLPITRQGARKHLQILVEAHVIQLQTSGRETTVTLDYATLEKARAFISELEMAWDIRLEALKHFVEE